MASLDLNAECIELVKSYQGGNAGILDVLLQKCAFLVDEVIKKRIHVDSYDYDLLYQIGMMGLVDAVKRFDSGDDFLKFAKTCIYYKITNHTEKYPYPTFTPADREFLLSLIKRFNLPIKGNLSSLRYFLELLPPKVKMCIKYKYGYFGGVDYSDETVAARLKCDTSAVTYALTKFEQSLQTYFHVDNKNEEEKIDNLLEFFSEASADDLRKAIFILPSKYRTIIERYFDNNLKKIREMSNLDKLIFNNNILIQIKINLISIRKNREEASKRNRLFEDIKGYSKDEIKQALKLISEEELEIITKKYGYDLSENNTLNDNEQIRFESALKSLKEQLRKLVREGKYITNYIKEYGIDDIKRIVDGLLSEDKGLIYLRFGNNLDEDNILSKEDNKKVYQILMKVRMVLDREKKLKTIYTFFPKNSHSQVISAVSKLDEEYQKVIYARYGVNLDEFNEVSTEDKKKIYSVIIPLLRKELTVEKDSSKKKRSKSIFSFFEGFSEEQVREAVSKLPENYQQVIYTRYGENLDELNPIDNTSSLYTTIMPMLKAILSNKPVVNSRGNGRTGRKIWEIFSEYSSEQIREAVSKLPENYRCLIYRKYGENLDEYNRFNDFGILYSKALPSLEMVLKGSIKPSELGKRGPKKKLLTYYLEGYSLDEIRKAVLMLPEEYQTRIYSKFGEGLDDSLSVDKKITTHFKNIILPKLSAILERQKNNFQIETQPLESEELPKEENELDLLAKYIEEIYDKVKSLSKEEIIIAILRIGTISAGLDKRALISYFGKSVEEINEITLKFLRIFDGNEDEITTFIASLFIERKEKDRVSIKEKKGI